MNRVFAASFVEWSDTLMIRHLGEAYHLLNLHKIFLTALRLKKLRLLEKGIFVDRIVVN